jgi:hypothetical protein
LKIVVYFNHWCPRWSMVMGVTCIHHSITQTIKIYDNLLVSHGPGSMKSGRSGVDRISKRRLWGGAASNSDIIPGDATAVGCGECVPAFNAVNPATLILPGKVAARREVAMAGVVGKVAARREVTRRGGGGRR